MKYNFLFLILLCGCSQFIEIRKTNKVGYTAKSNNLDKVGNEHQLDYTANNEGDKGYNYSYSETELNMDMADLSAHFFYRADRAIPIINTEYVDIKSIDMLNKEIYSDPNYDSGNSIAAIRMIYGFDTAQKKLMLVYEPIFLQQNNKNKYNIKQLTTERFYINVSNQLSENLFSTLKNRYIDFYSSTNADTSKVFIDHNIPGDNGLFIDDPLISKGDIRYCIIPIQQILRKYETEKKAATLSNMLAFHFGAKNSIYTIRKKYVLFHSTPLRSNNHKLHIMVFCTKPATGLLKNAYKNQGDGADFSGMCPPNQNGIVLNNY